MFTQDELLSKITVKGQDFTLIVEAHNEAKFLSTMEALGYISKRGPSWIFAFFLSGLGPLTAISPIFVAVQT